MLESTSSKAPKIDVEVIPMCSWDHHITTFSRTITDLTHLYFTRYYTEYLEDEYHEPVTIDEASKILRNLGIARITFDFTTQTVLAIHSNDFYYEDCTFTFDLALLFTIHVRRLAPLTTTQGLADFAATVQAIQNTKRQVERKVGERIEAYFLQNAPRVFSISSFDVPYCLYELSNSLKGRYFFITDEQNTIVFVSPLLQQFIKNPALLEKVITKSEGGDGVVVRYMGADQIPKRVVWFHVPIYVENRMFKIYVITFVENDFLEEEDICGDCIPFTITSRLRK